MKRLLDAVSVSTAMALLSLGVTIGVATASPPSLSGELLGSRAMPTGWNVAHPSSKADVGCFQSLFKRKGLQPTRYAKVGYEDRTTLQVFVEALATYAKTNDAYMNIIATISGCKRVDALTGGKATSIVARRMPFTHYGNASTAFSLRLEVQGLSFRDDMLVVRKGGVIMGIEEGGFPQVDSHQFEGLIAKALARLATR